jgi:hypothetical protein
MSDKKLMTNPATGLPHWVSAEPESPSAPHTPEPVAAPLVGTGEMVVRPLLHILLCDGKVRGWTDNREWAEQWANQYYLRSFVSGVPELRPHNIVDVGRAGNGASPAIQPKSNP